MKRPFFFIFLLLAFCLAAPFGWAKTPEAPRLIVHLLDYLAQDYGGAVQGGKVVNEGEYREQVEFMALVMQAEKELPADSRGPEFRDGLLQLQSLILQKADPSQVAPLARRLQSDLLKTSGLQVAPGQWPDLAKGAAIYGQNCAACHGAEGRGNGPAAGGLDPLPANFHEAERMELFTPLKGFNSIRLGIPGTAMAPFPNLSDQEVWDLSFYIASLRHQKTRDGLTPSELNSYKTLLSTTPLQVLATSTDRDLETREGGKTLEEQKKILSVLRSPPSKKSVMNFIVAREGLARSLEEYREGRPSQAKQEALKAYLEGVEPLEAPLRAKSPPLVAQIEGKMADLRTQFDGGRPYGEASQTVAALSGLFEKGEVLLQEGSSLWFMFLLSSSIILREGFEAILIIVAILGVLRALGQRRAALWVHGGWLAALSLGFIAWFVSSWLIRLSGAGREMMEGLTSLFAVAVLLYVGFWLHNKTEIHRWTAFIDGRTRSALATGNLASLAFISFAAVFREAFETVLFLQALSLEGKGGAKALAGGVAFSLALIILLTALLLKFSVRIPIRKLFMLSSALMISLAVVLTGKGVHSLQEMGWVPTTSFPSAFRSDLLGLYPTMETLLAQVLVVLIALLLWMIGKRPSSFGSPSAKTAEI